MSVIPNPAFKRYVGIDYSGAETPESSLKGLRVYVADHVSEPVELGPPPSPRKYWSRRGIAEWIVESIPESEATLIGIDHAFSFPKQYFDVHRLQPDWPAFLEDFRRHWPTDENHTYVDFVRDSVCGNGHARWGDPHWRRLTEIRSRTAKSVFHFDVPGSVAKSTHAGLPWLLHIRRHVGRHVHFWPFDGWEVPPEKSAIVEVYPRLWSELFPRENRTSDQHDAWSIAEWMRRNDRNGHLAAFLEPGLIPPERTIAEIEGWILGTVSPIG